MQSARTAPLNTLETHYAVYYANCTHCASEKKLCSIQNTLCIMQKALCVCMHHSECKQIFWLRRCHMKVSAYFAQGKRNEWEFSRCPCLNSFFKTDVRTNIEVDPASQEWTYSTKHSLYILWWEKLSFMEGPLGICHHCDKGNILRNKYLVTQSWTRIPIKIEFHEFPIKEFHLFSFLRYALKGPKFSNTRIWLVWLLKNISSKNMRSCGNGFGYIAF